MKKKLQVFVSSTYTDMLEERQAAVSAILKAGHIPAGMELFTAGDESQMETIKRWIDQSDVFMLILGGRYGSIEPTTGLSYTELEYNYAVESGKPLFAAVITESAIDRKVKTHGTSVIETENTKQLTSFRKKVLSRMSAFFDDVREIRLAVHETVADYLERFDFKGWVSGDEIPDIQSYIDQIAKLRHENKRLAEDRNALHAGAVFTPSEEAEFNHVRQKLDRDINLHHNLYRQKGGEKTSVWVGMETYKVNLLNAILYFVSGGQHKFSKRGIEYSLHEKLIQSHPLTGMPDVGRGDWRGIVRDNLTLELRTYGLSRFLKIEDHHFSESIDEFTEKMYRFVYWLDYNGYIPEIRFDFVSITEEAVSEVPTSEPETSDLQIIEGIDRELIFKAKHNKWRKTEEGVTSARREFERLCEELEKKVGESNDKSETFSINFSREAQDCCAVSAVGIDLLVTWQCRHPDTLDDSLLTVTANKSRFDVEGVQPFMEQQDALFTHELDLDMNRDSRVEWKRRQTNQTFSTDDLVENMVTEFIKSIQRRVASGK